MGAITITLSLPPDPCRPNWRGHWAVKSKAVKAYRTEAWSAARQAVPVVPPRWTAATCKIVFRFASNRRRDRDNLLASLKAAFDGIADAGIVVNDSGMTYLPIEILVDKTSQPGVTLTVEGKA